MFDDRKITKIRFHDTYRFMYLCELNLNLIVSKKQSARS